MSIAIKSIEERRAEARYRIQLSCANCTHLVRGWSGDGFVAGSCRLHDFPANLDRGICKDFNFGKGTSTKGH